MLLIVNLSNGQFNNVINFRSVKVAFFMRTCGQILKHINYSTEPKVYSSPRGFTYLEVQERRVDKYMPQELLRSYIC